MFVATSAIITGEKAINASNPNVADNIIMSMRDYSS